MTVAQLLLVAMSVLPVQSSPRNGAIAGIVVNASDQMPAGGARVILRVKLQGEFVPMGETTAGPEGKFLFKDLFVGPYYEYLPGANRDGIHYPGPHVRLTPARPQAVVKLEVCDSIAEPNPLVIRRYEILVRPEPGAVHVTETIQVDNPTMTCYVGKPIEEGEEPVTLELAVPPQFERITFHKEFFGRRFAVRHDKLVTAVPWTPGMQELKFTYVLPNEQAYRLWERPLDLPCSEVRLRVCTDGKEKVACNLAKSFGAADGEVAFESRGQLLPAGYVLRLELGHLPVPWMAYGRWAALAALGTLVAGGSLVLVRRQRRAKSEEPPDESASAPGIAGGPDPQGRRRSHGRKRGRKPPSRRAA